MLSRKVYYVLVQRKITRLDEFWFWFEQTFKKEYKNVYSLIKLQVYCLKRKGKYIEKVCICARMCACVVCVFVCVCDVKQLSCLSN